MGSRWGKFGFGRGPVDGDLEGLRRNLLDRPDEAVVGDDSSNRAEASGNTFNNYGPSTSAVLLVAALAAGALGMSFVNAMAKQQSRAEWDNRFDQAEKAWMARYEQQERSWQNRFELQAQKSTETQVACKLAERRMIDLESYALLNGWKVPKDDQHGPLGNLERLNGASNVR